MSTEKMTFGKAINRAMHRAMTDDPKVVLMGEDIGTLGGVFRITDGLIDEFGAQRVMDTPLAESGIMGTALGLAYRGYRPVVEIQFDGFVYPAFDQIVSNLAKMRARTAGNVQLPVTIRIPFGGGIGSPEHHSESPEAYFMHTAGLRVVSPSTPQEGYDLLRAAIASDDPVVYLEPKRRYHDKGEVDLDAEIPPMAPAKIVREGKDVTLVAYGPLVKTALQAAEVAAEEGIEIEVIDLRSIAPMDSGLVESSVRRTGRLVVTHEAGRSGGVGAELVATVTERSFHWLESPPVRVTGFDIPYPAAKLEDYHLPDLDRILDGVDRAMGRPHSLDSVDMFAAPETAADFLAAQAQQEGTR
ncbi:alpha-ketoacid dehydrogenase subunit beta [Micrococcus lylae]|uniref:Alpha-ketoacid dehydrogenase subunit beta n=1 Tax=Micrococcus lylae TaxID=1273 RepID=A0A1R4IPW7_9MICC|nr:MULTISPECIES: alpha-ketoacid dehydrogenase subunit beta [Micrococcus]OFR91266.1 2-oxoisovalerate dehydrogenase [Micrococcus sp. HMSC067E09]PNL17608.1 alpha-ketoacid dehydrogenase subunit beta [Micrococcus sp. FDAARGOS_333]TFH98271.1 alpha-ketoacid dehydrogenase subunit beta [Micrococcus lylae]WIK82470.1 alpha-ketoacid dehydrogenase subunit beta [Micrococcus lylae]SJN21273.1 Pyruvate dehydrogenase E1 component beta subunit [Micrococcus lylae]